jgi:hypothetical protein
MDDDATPWMGPASFDWKLEVSGYFVVDDT